MRTPTPEDCKSKFERISPEPLPAGGEPPQGRSPSEPPGAPGPAGAGPPAGPLRILGDFFCEEVDAFPEDDLQAVEDEEVETINGLIESKQIFEITNLLKETEGPDRIIKSFVVLLKKERKITMRWLGAVCRAVLGRKRARESEHFHPESAMAHEGEGSAAEKNTIKIGALLKKTSEVGSAADFPIPKGFSAAPYKKQERLDKVKALLKEKENSEEVPTGGMGLGQFRAAAAVAATGGIADPEYTTAVKAWASAVWKSCSLEESWPDVDEKIILSLWEDAELFQGPLQITQFWVDAGSTEEAAPAEVLELVPMLAKVSKVLAYPDDSVAAEEGNTLLGMVMKRYHPMEGLLGFMEGVGGLPLLAVNWGGDRLALVSPS